MSCLLAGAFYFVEINVGNNKVFIEKFAVHGYLSKRVNYFRAAPEINSVFIADPVAKYNIRRKQSCVAFVMLRVDFVVFNGFRLME